MTPDEITRLAVLEMQMGSMSKSVDVIAEDVKNAATKDDVYALSEKLDAAILCKADKSDMDRISEVQTSHDHSINRLYGALALVGAGMPFLLWLIGRAFGN